MEDGMDRVELRWLEIDGSKTLQWRGMVNYTDYTSVDGFGGYSVLRQWTEWQDVPVVQGVKL